MKFRNTLLLTLGLSSALLFTSTSASAVTISATELLRDPEPFELFSRDLQRTRSDSNGYLNLEDLDAAIIAQNLIDSNFGVLNTSDVSYRHDLTWLSPAAGSFLVASLTIEAFGNLGGDDIVFTDTINLGSLTDGTLGTGFFSLSGFSSGDSVILNAVLGDGYLDVFIDKNKNANFLGALNAFSVFSSSLTVRYETAAVPEPATFALLGSAALLALAQRRRKVANSPSV